MRPQLISAPGTRKSSDSFWSAALGLVLLVFLFVQQPQAEASATLDHLRTIQIASMGDGSGAAAVRQRIIDRLRKSKALKIVDNPSAADAVLQGSSSIWRTGSVSLEPRSTGSRQINYQGYLSVELVDKNHQTLWSYMVTPSRFHMSTITDDLADHLTQKLLDAVASGTTSSGTPTPLPAPNHQVALGAAGATFPAPLYQKWIQSSGMPVAYQAVGSEAGIQQLTEGKIDFAASDMPWSFATQPSDPQHDGSLHVLQIPTVLGGVVPIYNLSDAGKDLQFTPQILAGIYSGAIRKWNDSRIREVNRGAHLPDADIAVIYRSDGSGTTFVWTSYLSQVSPEWKSSVGADSHVSWPVGTGATGNEGIAATVKKTPYSIGYVELIYAIQHQLNYAALRNPSGQFVKATLSSITAAAGSSDASAGSVLDSPNRDAYPISTFTWLMVPTDKLSTEKKAAIAALLNWMLTSGQKDCAALGYAPLPHEIVVKELKALDALK